MARRHVADGIVIDLSKASILMQTRRKSGDGLLYLPGGKIEPGERDYAAIRRELAEEINVSNFSSLIHAFNHKHSGLNSERVFTKYMFHVFLCLLDDFSEVANNEPEKHELVVLDLNDVGKGAPIAENDLNILRRAHALLPPEIGLRMEWQR
jgi:8-oxo-dGTP pyrophosphatase MutT (NUDIX family)